MAHEIVTFESGEFEIALVTYNRCEFVAEWLERCFIQTKIRNISLSIWDSSTNPDTEEYIKEFNVKENADITYYHVSSLYAILCTHVHTNEYKLQVHTHTHTNTPEE